MPTATRAADGFDRRAFTVDEILRMQDVGIISEDENFELVEGEIVPMSPKYSAHERIKSRMLMALARSAPANLIIGVETSIFLSSTTFLEPDICIYPERLQSQDVRGPDILLAVEIAASSIAYDRGVKAQLFARYAVRELWVIDADTRRAWVHKEPSERGWGSVTERAASDDLQCEALPGFVIRLGEIV